ncbi:unnamed protein product [Rotaria sordida]|uniref:Cytochrome P450 n=1 Tax=Rotaria sordida TaxID=392033 RepID=A0A814TG62_9BILA|nr:unnamed protein product [Rotaria sordida]
MSKYPLVQSKLKTELAEYHHQRLSIEQLNSLSYLDCVLREVLRSAPPIIGTLRTLQIDDRLPSSARDARYWLGPINPDQFYPERFQNEDNTIRNKAAWIVFGGGHRQYMGQDLARLELKAICARLMQHVTFSDGGVDVNAGGYKHADTLLPKRIGVTITFD